jgi:hypothetical protein
VLLEGWTSSRGTLDEYFLAEQLGLDVYESVETARAAELERMEMGEVDRHGG